MRLGVACVVVMLTGCAGAPPTAPDGGQLSQSDYGDAPADADKLIGEYLRGRLKDPYSAQVEKVAGPSTVWMKGSVFGSGAYGWGLCFRVNAKNSFGAYTGFRTYALIYRNGSILRSFGDLRGNMFDEALAQGLCKQLGA